MAAPRKIVRATKSLPPPSERSFADASTLPLDSLLKETHINDLCDKGYTVVENVMPAAECESLKSAWLATMASYEGTGFRADDRSTWTTANLPDNIRGMQNWPPVADEAFVWNARLATAPVFAALWGCAPADLISSMDRVCFVPYERLRINKANQAGWPHLDQARATRRGTLECVQGFVTLNDIGPNEVALQVYEGAHKYHKRFFEEVVCKDADRAHKCANDDWCKFDAAAGTDRAWYMAQPGVKEVRVHAPAGSLILWESRLPHHAMPPADNAQRSRVDRFVIYSCMVPRAWASDAVLAKRIKSFETGRATPHWPHEGKAFPHKPRTYSKDTKLLDANFDPRVRQLPALETRTTNYRLVKRLVGFE